MVSPQATQPAQPPHPRPTDWQREGESVRITAEDVPTAVRRQILREHYEYEFTKQAAQSAFDSNDLAQLRRQGLPHEEAKMRASNSKAVLQRIAANLTAFGGDRNRDFVGRVTR